MSFARNPNRTPAFRLITIASSGLGSFLLGIWGLKFGFGDGLGGMSAESMIAIVSALCALAAGGAAMSFYAGIDESADYVFQETHFDKLTGVLTRSAMVARIAEAAAQTVRTGEPVYLIDIDIDRFKQINDAIGYSQGDNLVAAFTARLKAACRKASSSDASAPASLPCSTRTGKSKSRWKRPSTGSSKR